MTNLNYKRIEIGKLSEGQRFFQAPNGFNCSTVGQGYGNKVIGKTLSGVETKSPSGEYYYSLNSLVYIRIKC
jgi:hypothetical protein